LVEDNIATCISTGEQCDFEAVLLLPKTKKYGCVPLVMLQFINGKCKRIYGSFQDINERKEAEVRLQSLADNLPGVVFQYPIYTDGQFKICNKAGVFQKK
jgi:PAS domain-containing protein